MGTPLDGSKRALGLMAWGPIGDGGPGGGPASALSQPHAGFDRMAYMADLLLELKDMASAEGHATLAGLLALAHAEAKQKSR